MTITSEESIGQTSSPQPQQLAKTPTQKPLYPPGLGWTPLFRRAAIHDAIQSWRETAVGYGDGSILLDGPSAGLGLYCPNATTTSTAAQTTRRAASSDVGFSSFAIAEPVLHLPPHAGRDEAMTVLPEPRLSMSPDEFDSWIANLERLRRERERAELSCPLCRHKASTFSETQCDVNPVNPVEFMDFRFLDRDDYYFLMLPSPSLTPPVQEDACAPRSWKENTSTPPDDDFLASNCPRMKPYPRNQEDFLCPMKGQWFREGLTADDILELWCDGHIRSQLVGVSAGFQGRTEEHPI